MGTLYILRGDFTNTDNMAALHEQLFHLGYNHWVNQEVFTSQWWVMFFSLLVMYVVWWKLADKTRLAEIVFFGALVAVIGGGADIVGTSLNLWAYQIRLLPLEPGPFPFDFTAGPIMLMLAYQYSRSWTTYFAGSVIASIIFGFIMLPIFQAIGVLQFIRWNYGFGFLLLMFISVVVRFVYFIIIETTEKACHAQNKQSFEILQPAISKPLPKEEDRQNGDN